MTTDTVPNPGSDEALREGCTCPILDNAHGRGVKTVDGVLFWYNGNCPLHTKPPESTVVA